MGRSGKNDIKCSNAKRPSVFKNYSRNNDACFIVGVRGRGIDGE